MAFGVFKYCFRKLYYILNITASYGLKESVTWVGPALTALVTDLGGATGVIESSAKNRHEKHEFYK